MKKYIFLPIIFYLFCLFETSLFNFINFKIDFILILFLSILFFKKQKWLPLILAFWGGGLLDIFSGFYFGTSILAFLLIWFLFLIILIFVREINVFIFSVLILVGTVIFKASLFLSSFLFSKVVNSSVFYPIFGQNLLFEFLGNIILGIAIFYIIRMFKEK